MKKNKILFFILFIISHAIIAQPVLLKLTSNPVLKQSYALSMKQNRILDTVELPFFDDFSAKQVYPDSNRWIDKNVYINQTFGQHPPSIGVATFDIITMSGEIYTNASTDPFIADYLTSQPINLKYKKTLNPISVPTNELYYLETATGYYHHSDSLYYISGTHTYNCFYQPSTFTINMTIYYDDGSGMVDVSDSLYYYDLNTQEYVHIEHYNYYYYTVADSLYFSFYYEGKGFGGNAPESDDSLVLEFKTPSSDWHHVWSSSGKSDTSFTQIMLPIRDSSYLCNGFQFRFYNYGSIGSLSEPSFAGNLDFWNLDYVYLDINRSMNDTISMDVTFVYPIPSFIEHPFISVPWEHYKQLDSLQNDSVYISYTNLYNNSANITRHMKIDNITTQQNVVDDSLGSENINPFATFSFWYHTASKILFPTNTEDESVFKVTLTQIAPTFQYRKIYNQNDTMEVFQMFKNFYAYDDGSAEYGVGLSGSGSENGMLAMKFTTLVPDTLRGVYMYFNQTYNNASQKYFYLTVWNDNNGKPGDILYKKTGVKPQYYGINDFYYYNLDTTLYLTEPFYIGWIQTTTDLINIGFDMNTDYSSYTFYNLDGTWNKFPFVGTLMIRPVFSKKPFVSIPENNGTTNTIVYPNPASDMVYINADAFVSYALYDIRGKIIGTGYDNIFSVTSISNGIYFLKITTKKQTSVHKIIIQHS